MHSPSILNTPPHPEYSAYDDWFKRFGRVPTADDVRYWLGYGMPDASPESGTYIIKDVEYRFGRRRAKASKETEPAKGTWHKRFAKYSQVLPEDIAKAQSIWEEGEALIRAWQKPGATLRMFGNSLGVSTERIRQKIGAARRHARQYSRSPLEAWLLFEISAIKAMAKRMAMPGWDEAKYGACVS